MKTATKKVKVKTIDIQAKEWFDKVNGNSYFSGIVTVNYGLKDALTFKMPFQYGYGGQSKQEALKILKENNLIESSYTADLREAGIVLRSNMHKNCLKRDVVAYGL